MSHCTHSILEHTPPDRVCWACHLAEVERWKVKALSERLDLEEARAAHARDWTTARAMVEEAQGQRDAAEALLVRWFDDEDTDDDGVELGHATHALLRARGLLE